MPRLERIHLLNAAGFDEVEFPVDSHCQVIGVNGHGKSTLLRTVLFFYLGTNEKAPYALHERKADFVSHYLGDPPGYLIYEVARGDGQLAWHLVVTRPAGRIQFHFVDTPYRREYYVDGRVVLPIERVQDQWRGARCAVETHLSYDAFSDRIYSLVHSTFNVFRPAARSIGQVSVLPRIISGIFTVSQLDADKLKAALTCGVRSDATAAELDLVQLRIHLENFRRVNRAVKTYLRHEQDAVNLVELATSFEMAKADRLRAIESLVRAAKLLPAEAERIAAQLAAVNRERADEDATFERESGLLNDAFNKRGEQIAVLSGKIEEAKNVAAEYAKREIERKAKELAALPQREEDRRRAESELATLTAEFADENQRKEQLLASVRQSWLELRSGLQTRRTEVADEFRRRSSEFESEKEAVLAKMVGEQATAGDALKPRRAALDAQRTTVSTDLKTFVDAAPPRELAETETRFRKADREQIEEGSRTERLRGELTITRQQAKIESEQLDRETAAEKERIAAAIAASEAECARATTELESFDASLAHFFQTRARDSWPDAAKTLSRDVLFQNAAELDAKVAPNASQAVWGVELSAANLPDGTDRYDRARLTTSLRESRSKLAAEKDSLTAAGTRYIADFAALEKRHAQIASALDAKISASVETRGQLGDEAIRQENHWHNLRSQYDAVRTRQREELDARETAWKADDEKWRHDEADVASRFRALLGECDASFRARREKLATEEAAARAELDRNEQAAAKHREEEIARIERETQQALAAKGADAKRVAAAQQRLTKAEAEVTRIGDFREEVAEYRSKKSEWIDRLPAWEGELKTAEEIQRAKKASLDQLAQRHRDAQAALAEREKKLNEAGTALRDDEKSVTRFQEDARFSPGHGCFERPDLPPASFYTPGAVGEFLNAAATAHESRESIAKKGDAAAKTFLRRFDSETLDRRLLGFSPLHEHFEWSFFVGGELKPFVQHHAIAKMKRLQTQEFEQLVHNICNKNAAFRDGIRQVNQTAASVQEHLAEHNFVDVLDSIELKVERVDNQLTRTLEGLEKFAGLSFGQEHDLFAKRAERAEIDRAIEHFERLLKEIDNHRSPRLSLTDYFDFLIRVHENGHDMGWRKSLDDIGSTGTDYLVKMLVYLALIEVYRARAIDARFESAVHCVMDETGVLAPKYVRAVLAYAKSRGITLITAGHSQEASGFDHVVRVRMHGHRFTGQRVLRKILRCD